MSATAIPADHQNQNFIGPALAYLTDEPREVPTLSPDFSVVEDHHHNHDDKNTKNNNSHLDGPRDLLAGMLSGFVCKVFEFPFDTVKVLQQTQGDKYTSALDCIQQTVRSKGNQMQIQCMYMHPSIHINI